MRFLDVFLRNAGVNSPAIEYPRIGQPSTRRRAGKYMPRRNVPKSQRVHRQWYPAPPLGPVGLAWLGHPPRPRKGATR